MQSVEANFQNGGCRKEEDKTPLSICSVNEEANLQSDKFPQPNYSLQILKINLSETTEIRPATIYSKSTIQTIEQSVNDVQS